MTLHGRYERHGPVGGPGGTTGGSAGGSTGGGTRSVLSALRILEEVSRRQPVGVSELTRALGLPKTSVQRSLQTLREAGWVRPGGAEATRWTLTTRALTVGLAGATESGLREVAVGEMAAIRDATGETVHLSVPDEQSLVVIARLDGTHSLRTFLPLGTRAPLHATASGRAMLSSMSDEQVDRVLDHGLQRYTDHTILQREDVWREVRLARQRGYATNAGEWRVGIGAIGIPIVSRTGSPLAAFAVSMPFSRFQEVDHADVAGLVIEAARRVDEALHG